MEKATKDTAEQELVGLMTRAAPEANAAVDAYEPVEQHYFAATSALNPSNLYVTSTHTVYRP
jgi:hypothetical protein